MTVLAPSIAYLSASVASVACLLTVLPTVASAAAATVTGTATYRERMALPPDAAFEATLEDVSRADAAAEVLGRTRIESPGNPPISFTLSYDDATLDPSHQYVVRARITRADQLLFTTDTQHRVLGPDRASHVDIVLRRVAATPPRSTASLENTYWKLTRLSGQPVRLEERQREPHLIMQPGNANRIVGYGGYNRFTGSYALDADQLTFSQLAGTLMACPQGMELEKEFHNALGRVAHWRIDGETLELSDANGEPVAVFESRYLQ